MRAEEVKEDEEKEAKRLKEEIEDIRFKMRIMKKLLESPKDFSEMEEYGEYKRRVKQL